jgi:hypothetical protein
VDQWKALLFEHDMLALVCEFLPQQYRWKDAYNADVKIALKTLVRGISKEVQKCLSMSNVHWKNGDRRTSIKNFVHATRYLGFASQIASFNAIQDLGVSNERQKDAMERIKDETATYDSFSLFYKPQILSMLTTFQDSVQTMILDEIAFADSLLKTSALVELSSDDPTPGAIIEYLNLRGLANLRRFFCLTITLHSQSEHWSRYILSATPDSPPGHPFTTSCGCTLVELIISEDKFRLLASPRNLIDTRTLDSPSVLPSDFSQANAPHLGTRIHINDCEMVQCYDQTNGVWSTFCTSSLPNITSIEETFRRQFVALGLKYPEDKRLCITWLYNWQTGQIRLIAVSGGEFPFQGDQFDGWPKFDLEPFETVEDIKWRVSELEMDPLEWSGLYFPGRGSCWKIQSRSRLSYDWVSSMVDDDTENGAHSQSSRHYCMLALSLARNASFLRDLPLHVSTAVESELETYSSVTKSVLFFWSLVKAHADAAAEFTKRMAELKFWNPVIAVMQAVRQHPTRDPLKILFTSHIKVYLHWKTVFDGQKIQKLVDSVSSLVKPSPASSST